jgi:hypothetical protein
VLVLSAYAQAQTLQPAPAASGPGPTEIQTLVSALRDDKTRAILLEALERAGGKSIEEAPAAPVTSEVVQSLGQQLAVWTKSFTETSAAKVEKFVGEMTAVPRRFAALDGRQFHVLMQAIWDVGLIIIATYALLTILRALTPNLHRRLGQISEGGGRFRKVSLMG